jgi:hypothetical protein
MILLVLLLIIPTLDTHSNSFVSTTGPNDFTSLTVNLVKSLGQVVDTNELEWEPRVGKINSKTSKVIRSGSKYKWVRVSVKSGED